MKIYAKIMKKIKGKSVIQIQMYGLERLYMKNSFGIFQLAISKILQKKFNVELTYTDSMPRYPAEIEYLKQEKISFFTEEKFSVDQYYNIIAKAEVENPIIICYFSCFEYYAYRRFSSVQWDPEISKRHIFITNDKTPIHLSNIYFTEEKVKAVKWCTELMPIVVEPKEHELQYGSISSIKFEHVQEAIREAQKICFHSALAVYTQIISALKGKTVIQIQMYGLGKICHKNENGAIQLAVALRLFNKFKVQYPGISMTSQEPQMFPVEIQYLKSLNITIFEGKNFCSLRILSDKNVSNPATIIYCIHFPVFEEFLEAHWNAKILSQIIFVSNKRPDYPNGKKSWYYFQFCESLPINEKCPAYCTTDEERRNWFAFCSTNVHTISYKNALYLINQLK